MLDIKNVEVKISDSQMQKVANFLRGLWFGMPKWLRNVLVVTLFMGAVYFIYNRIAMSYDMDILRQEVIDLNKKCQTVVMYDRYIYDIHNLIDLFRTLKNERDGSYKAELTILDLLKSHLEDTDPKNPLIDDIERVMRQATYAKESYDQLLERQIAVYDEIAPELGAPENSAHKSRIDSIIETPVKKPDMSFINKLK